MQFLACLSSYHISLIPIVRTLTPHFQILIVLVPALLCLLWDSNRPRDKVITHYECQNTCKVFLLDERRPTLGLTAWPKVEAMYANKDPRYTASPLEAGRGVFLMNILGWDDYGGELMTS